MKLKIPFYPNKPKDETDKHGHYCQEMSLMSIINFFEQSKYSFDDMIGITSRKPDKACWAFPYSLWLIDNGYSVKRITTVDYDAFARNGIAYIRQAYGDEIAQWQAEESDIELALETVDEYIEKVELINKQPMTDDINSAMEEGYLVKLMIDHSVLNASDRYLPHSVTVTGFDSTHFYIHDSGLPPLENRKIETSLLQAAMDSFGGEMDLIKLLGR